MRLGMVVLLPVLMLAVSGPTAELHEYGLGVTHSKRLCVIMSMSLNPYSVAI